MNIQAETYEGKKIINDDANLSEGALSSWWPTTSNVEEVSSSEWWWPTNPVIIDSLEAKSPSESTMIDWSFLDDEYHDLPLPIDNKEQVEDLSSSIESKIEDRNIGLLPHYSKSSINNMQINMPKSARNSNIEGPKAQSRKGSLSVIDTIKEMTTYYTNFTTKLYSICIHYIFFN